MAEPYASRRRPRGRHRRHDRVRKRRLAGFLIVAAIAVGGAAWFELSGDDGSSSVAAGDTSVPRTIAGGSGNGTATRQSSAAVRRARCGDAGEPRDRPDRALAPGLARPADPPPRPRRRSPPRSRWRSPATSSRTCR